MKLIALYGKYGEGKFAQVDDEDFERVNQFNWYMYDGYAMHRFYNTENIGEKSRGKVLRMHNFILDISDYNIRPDHKDLDKLNCQKYNLRLATIQQNGFNRNKNKNNTSGYKGVTFKKRRSHLPNPWCARIGFNKKQIHLGYFTTAPEAAIAYNEAAIKYFGEFARLNELKKK